MELLLNKFDNLVINDTYAIIKLQSHFRRYIVQKQYLIRLNIYKTYIVELQQNINHKQHFRNETNITSKCIYAKLHLSSNTYGPLFEQYIKQRLSIKRTLNSISGDGIINGYNIEIKISLGDKHGCFHYVQIRPDHNIHYYMLMAYKIFEKPFGQVYWFLIPHDDIIEIINDYGSYAHGTITKLGKINRDNISGRNCEYAFRPNPTLKNTTKSYISFNEIYNILN